MVVNLRLDANVVVVSSIALTFSPFDQRQCVNKLIMFLAGGEYIGGNDYVVYWIKEGRCTC